MQLDDRKQKLLMALVERHIRDGQPVGSKTLAAAGGIKASAATVRNLMAELESLDMLYSPHTSAGRVPTETGYRLYVDSLLAAAPLNRPDNKRLKQELSALLVPEQGRSELLDRTSRVLAELTRMAGVVVMPQNQQTTLRQVEFLPLSGQRVLVVLVLNRAEVQNRVITTDKEYTPEELYQAANYINGSYAGFTLSAICDDLLANMHSDRHAMDSLMQTTLDVAGKGLQKNSDEKDYLLAGESNLLGMAEGDNLDQLRDLFEAFSHKHDLLHLLEKASQADGVQIFIGHESGHDAFADYSLVATPYEGIDDALGVLAVVGPTRMDYERVIPTVDITARALSAALRGF